MKASSARASSPTPGAQGMDGYRQARGGVERFVSENPILVGSSALRPAFFSGRSCRAPGGRDRAFGAWSDEVRDQGRRYAQDMAQRGREYVEEAFSDDDPRFAQHDSEYRGRGRRKDR